MTYLQIRARKHPDDLIPVDAVLVAAVLMTDTYAIGWLAKRFVLALVGIVESETPRR